MKLIIILFLAVPLSSLAQKNPIGTYQDNLGTRLEIRKDSTFLHTHRFHLYSSWTKGIWYTQVDTIHFSMTPVWDTVRLKSHLGSKDTLILSIDSFQSRETEFYFDTLRGYGQKYYDYPKKLIFTGRRLYQIGSDGKPFRNRVKSYGRKKKVPTWLYRTS